MKVGGIWLTSRSVLNEVEIMTINGKSRIKSIGIRKKTMESHLTQLIFFIVSLPRCAARAYRSR